METNTPELDILARRNSPAIAYRHRAGRSPTLVFLPGYGSDMDGAKAVAIDQFAAERGQALVRFDFSGTGASGGRFEDGTLELWLEEAVAIVDALTAGPLILVGSSMGGWIALHVALARRDRVVAVLGIAAAPDFTEWGFTPDQKARLHAEGRLVRESPHGGNSQLTTLEFWKSGERLKLLGAPIRITCPVRLVHGDADSDVPLAVATRLMNRLCSANVQLNIIKDGGHRLSEPHQIAAILHALAALLELPE